MILLQQLIPMPIPVPFNSNSGPTGPWTHEDTKIVIAVWTMFFLWWIVSAIIERVVKKTSFKDILTIDANVEFTNTAMSTMYFYAVNGIILATLIAVGIYKLL